jgi:ketosteroid isomerase-like protein
MSTQENIQIVKNFLAALGRRDKQGLLALSAEDIEWIIPGEDWPLAGTHRGHAGLENLLQKANETVETSYPKPPEFIPQGDRVLVVGSAVGKIKATDKTFGQLGLRHHRSQWQSDEHPGVYRHASTGAGLRDCRESQALIHQWVWAMSHDARNRSDALRAE